MADTFTIAGKHVNKWLVYGGIGVVAVAGVLWYRHEKGSSSSGSSDSSAIDPVTGLPYSEDNQVDPATGMTYVAEAEQYGSVQAAEEAVAAGYGASGGADEGYSGLGYGYPTYDTGSGTSAVATNAEWAAEVQAALPGITGDTASDVATAIANYLAGLPLTSTQANDIQVALSEFGPPPGGALPIVQQSSASGPTSTGSAGSTGSGTSGTTTTTTSGSGSGSTGTTTTPGAPKAAGAISNLQAYSVTSTGFTAKWNPASGATGGYAWEVNELDGTVSGKGNTSSTSFSISDLHPGWTYNVGVQALPGGPGDNIHVTLPSK